MVEEEERLDVVIELVVCRAKGPRLAISWMVLHAE